MLKQERWSPEFSARYARHLDELKWLFCELYDTDMDAFARLTARMAKAYRTRSEALRRRDRAREADPGWYRSRALIGTAQEPGYFSDGGDLGEKLAQLKACGAGLIHPAGEVPGELVAACRRRNILLCLDVSFAADDPAHRAEESAERYFIYNSRAIPDEFEKTLPPCFVQAGDGWVMTDEKGRWAVNYHSAEVFIESIGHLLDTANRGADILYLGDVTGLWKQLYTDCRGLAPAHNLVRMVRMVCEVVCPGTVLMARGDSSFFGPAEKPQCQLLEDPAQLPALWNTVATRDVRLLRRAMDTAGEGDRVFALQNGEPIRWLLDYGFLAELGCREMPHRRFLTDYFTGRIYWSPARGEATEGNPETCDFSLIGSTAALTGLGKGLAEGDAALTRLGQNCALMLHAFILTRGGLPMVWSGDLPALRESDRGRQLRAMEKARAEHPAFDPAAHVWTQETGSRNVLALGRHGGGEQLLALFNFSENEIRLHLSEFGAWQDILTGKAADPADLCLGPYNFRWLVRR